MKNNYSPFEKEIEKLTSSDLFSLKHAHEGWYIEYKSEMVNASAIAKAISAFANTYGGWLFVGIAEDSKANNVAGKFIGVPTKEKDQIRQKVRSALASNVQPTPYYDLSFVDGPDGQIGLDQDKSILVIHVPHSMQAPHVHKDGRIYKRVSDSSEPKPETDPHLLNQLWSRREKADATIKRWVEDNPEFSKAESDSPYLRILLTPDDWGQSQAFLNASMKEVRDVLNGSPKEGAHMPLETTYLTNTGYIGRQIGNNNRHNYGVTFQIDRYLTCDLVIPLRWHNITSDELWLYLEHYEHAEDFIQCIGNQNDNCIKIMDLNYLYSALCSMVAKYRNFMHLAGKETPYFAKVILLNGWRFVPFLDDQDYIKQIKKHGIPMVMQEEAIAPPGKNAGSFLEIFLQSDREEISEESKSATQAFQIVKEVFELMGIDVFFDDTEVTESSHIDITNLLMASKRAMKNQERALSRKLNWR